MNSKSFLIMLCAASLSACGAADPDSSTDSDGLIQTNQSTTAQNGSTGDTITPENPTANNTNNVTTPTTIADDPLVTSGEGFDGVFAALIAEGGCSAGYCHGGGVATADLMYDFLVSKPGKAETTCDASLLVAPGDPDASILWYRVRPSSMDEGAPCATKMPGGSETGLSGETAALVRDWILDGAPR